VAAAAWKRAFSVIMRRHVTPHTRYTCRFGLQVHTFRTQWMDPQGLACIGHVQGSYLLVFSPALVNPEHALAGRESGPVRQVRIPSIGNLHASPLP